MDLYIHAGLNKTGSSYIQSILAQSRDFFSNFGIYYSSHERDAEAISGEPTSGNGIDVAFTIRSLDYDKSANLLKNFVSEAKNLGCNKIVFSSEAFYHSIVKPGVLDCLWKAAKSADISKIKILLFFRNPIDHAISTFVHRASFGMKVDFTRWLQNDYELVHELETFLADARADKRIEYDIRKYEPQKRDVAEVTILDWLGLSKFPEHKYKSVNTSILPSEALLLQEIERDIPSSAKFIGKQLKRVDKKQKGDTKENRKMFEIIAAKHLLQYSALFEKLNEQLPTDEKLDIDFNDISENKSSYNMAINLSSSQINALTRGFAEYYEFNSFRKVAFRKAINFRRRAFRKVKKVLGVRN